MMESNPCKQTTAGHSSSIPKVVSVQAVNESIQHSQIKYGDDDDDCEIEGHEMMDTECDIIPSTRKNSSCMSKGEHVEEQISLTLDKNVSKTRTPYGTEKSNINENDPNMYLECESDEDNIVYPDDVPDLTDCGQIDDEKLGQAFVQSSKVNKSKNKMKTVKNNKAEKGKQSGITESVVSVGETNAANIVFISQTEAEKMLQEEIDCRRLGHDSLNSFVHILPKGTLVIGKLKSTDWIVGTRKERQDENRIYHKQNQKADCKKKSTLDNKKNNTALIAEDTLPTMETSNDESYSPCHHDGKIEDLENQTFNTSSLIKTDKKEIETSVKKVVNQKRGRKRKYRKRKQTNSSIKTEHRNIKSETTIKTEDCQNEYQNLGETSGKRKLEETKKTKQTNEEKEEISNTEIRVDISDENEEEKISGIYSLRKRRRTSFIDFLESVYSNESDVTEENDGIDDDVASSDDERDLTEENDGIDNDVASSDDERYVIDSNKEIKHKELDIEGEMSEETQLEKEMEKIEKDGPPQKIKSRKKKKGQEFDMEEEGQLRRLVEEEKYEKITSNRAKGGKYDSDPDFDIEEELGYFKKRNIVKQDNEADDSPLSDESLELSDTEAILEETVDLIQSTQGKMTEDELFEYRAGIARAKKHKKKLQELARKNAEQKLCTKLEDYPDMYEIDTHTSTAKRDRNVDIEVKSYKRFSCKKCEGYATTDKTTMESHIELHLKGKLNCTECDQVFCTVNLLKIHCKRDHQMEKYLCPHCGTSYFDYTGFQRHLTRVHSECIHSCDSCSERFMTKKLMKEHALEKHPDKYVGCSICGKIFKGQKNLVKHQFLADCEPKKDDNKDEKATCEHCGKLFAGSYKLRLHIKRVHQKIHLFKCDKCSYSSGHRGMYRDHLMTHTGEHRHRCELCDFSCIKAFQLTCHMRTHTGHKPYKCDQCNYASAWNVQLKEHKKAHMSVLRIECKPCQIVYRDQKSLNLHLRKEHKKKEIPVVLC